MNQIRWYGIVFASLLLCLWAWNSSDAQNTILPKDCVDCHGSEPKFAVRGIRSQYQTSGHRILGNASFANSDDCQGCHTNEGFVERIKTGKVDVKKSWPTRRRSAVLPVMRRTTTALLHCARGAKWPWQTELFSTKAPAICARAVIAPGACPKLKCARAIFPRIAGERTTVRRRTC